MLTAISLSKPYAEIYSRDPALVQLPANATAKQRKDHQRKLDRCRETGSWQELLVAGAEPTLFQLRMLEGEHYRKLHTVGGGNALVTLQLAFRCALVDVENCGGITMQFEDTVELGRIASAALCNQLDAIDKGIINELGALVLARANKPPPLG